MKSHQLLLIIAIALPWVGCKTISTTTTLPNGETTTEIHAEKMKAVKAAAKPRRGVPENIVPVWQNASLTLSKQVPTRGFAGRIYFHDHQENPLIVDGELIVYGFNEGRLKKHGKPEKRFVFSSEELAKYLRMSTAGASYNVWLPWDELGGVEKKVSLIAFFKDASGKVVQGSSINAVLPGTKDQLEEGAKSLVDEVWEKEAAKRNTKKVGFEQQIASKSRASKSTFEQSRTASREAGAALDSGSDLDGNPEKEERRVTEFRLTPGSRERLFKPVPTRQYRLPKPKIYIPGQTQSNNSAAEPSAS